MLRKEMTKTEKTLWRYLSNRGFCQFKFRRQYPLAGFILDFYCPEKRMGIEIDGPIHDNKPEHDKERQVIIENYGIRVLRLKNEQIEKELDSALKAIKHFITPSLSRAKSRDGEGVPELVEGGGEDGKF
ncbi:endonuclease domain-containing protein [Candidatus Saganbacteria bacterium]|nr:endonuclease domain-containing protein [Candidatus Saganbacteria bacterium]